MHGSRWIFRLLRPVVDDRPRLPVIRAEQLPRGRGAVGSTELNGVLGQCPARRVSEFQPLRKVVRLPERLLVGVQSIGKQRLSARRANANWLPLGTPVSAAQIEARCLLGDDGKFVASA